MLISAVATPLKEDFSIDINSFEKLLEHQMNIVDGIVVAGTTGQGTLLSQLEKTTLLKSSSCLPCKRGVCISDVSFDRVIENIEMCSPYSIDFFLLTPPFFVRSSQEAILDFFQSVLSRSFAPVILYNNPARVGVHIDDSVLESLKDHKNFFGVKESSQKSIIIGSQIKVFCGDDEQLTNYKNQNAFGAISVLSNLFPKRVKGVLESQLEDASFIDKLTRCFVGVNPLPIQYMLYRIGLFQTPHVKREIGSLSKQKMDLIDSILEESCLKLV